MTKKEELLKKIKALADNGVGGEKDSATEILKTLMDKYGISESDIDDERKDFHWYRYSNHMEKRLICQVMYMVTGETVTYGNSRKRQTVGVRCTMAENIEIDACIRFYVARLKEDLEVFFGAFVQKSHILPADAPCSEAISETDMKMLKMAQGMEKHEFRKQITEDWRSSGI